jgi:hypothetical protein
VNRNRLAETNLEKDALTDFRRDFSTDFIIYSRVLCISLSLPRKAAAGPKMAESMNIHIP